MIIDRKITAKKLKSALDKFWELSGQKILRIEKELDSTHGAPVFTVKGKYTSRGWTEWTQGFQFGSSILQYEATGDPTFLELGRKSTIDKMAPHLSHFGVHDHGFNNVSTYGNLLRLMKSGQIPHHPMEEEFYKLALKVSGAVQAKRWTSIPEGGFIYSFNGPHSLFVDTIRSLRALVLSHSLGHYLSDEHDQKVSLLSRAIQHAESTAKYAIYYGEGRDQYDQWGRTAHESVFNTNDGAYRCPNSQQGYSGFTTWTRGLAWAMTGFIEQLEYLTILKKVSLRPYGGFDRLEEMYLKAATATCDFYISNTPTDGIPYWDTGAPGLAHMGDYLNESSNPFNHFEPVDSSAAAIGAQGLLRLGHYLRNKGLRSWKRYWQAGLTVTKNVLSEPYLSEDPNHQGLILHAIYHHPNRWDYIPRGSKIPCGESCMWGDYHARELAIYLKHIIEGESYYTFFNDIK